MVKPNFNANEVDLIDVLNSLKRDILINLNCHHIGTIQSFDTAKQTVEASLNYKRTFFRPNAIGVVSPVLEDYPVIIDAPVIILGGGNGLLTFPIQKGDECILLFNDRDIDNWFSGSSTSGVASPRLHAFTDAIALIGPRSLSNIITNYSSESVDLRTKSGNVKVSIFENKIVATVDENSKLEVFEDKLLATIGNPPTTFEINSTGKLKIENEQGEFVNALIQALQTATAGGFPLVADLTILQSFMET